MQLPIENDLFSKNLFHNRPTILSVITPARYKTLANTLSIQYSWHMTLWGSCLIAITMDSICHLSFETDKKVGLDHLQAAWPYALLKENSKAVEQHIAPTFADNIPKQPPTISLLLQGTTFQEKVWQALLAIPFGLLATYQAIAQRIDQPTAIRSVANAIAQNKIALLIPCHRVVSISKTGTLGKYRWGEERKKLIVAWEAGNRPKKS